MSGTLRLLAVLVLTLAGCVAAYDPAASSRFGLATRAEEVGTTRDRPRVPRQPWWTRRAAATAPAEPAPQPPIAAAIQVDPALDLPTLEEPAVAIPDTPAGRQLAWFIAVLRGGTTRGLQRHFHPAFLEKIPAAEVREIVNQWRRDELANGPVEVIRVDSQSPQRLVTLIRGRATDRYTQITLGVDNAGLITALWLGPVAGIRPGELTTWAKIEARLGQLPGRPALAVYEVTADAAFRPVFTHAPADTLAIGTASFLYIARALAEEVNAGRLGWETRLAISDDLKSLPGGRMQLELEGLEFPVSRFAELMLSADDLTAADHLLQRLGRERVEDAIAEVAAAPAWNRPYLSTMELFRLKLGPDRTLATRYAAADEATRRAMLAPGGEVQQSVPSLEAMSTWRQPIHIAEIGWFATPAELCRLMVELVRTGSQPGMEPIGHGLRLNPGLQFEAGRWTVLGYKGGSEPGVLSMTWLLERADGRRFAIAFIWNNPAQDVDGRAATEIVSAAVALLGEEVAAAPQAPKQ